MADTPADASKDSHTPKRLNAADRRRQLLRVAKKLFAQNGYKTFLRFVDERIPIISRYFVTVRRAILIP